MGESPEYDVIVIGAGHAGCEAALAASRMGCKTLLLTINLDSIAILACSPTIGGPGRGQLVREIDALGGEMGKNTDRAGVHFRRTNTSKGPAVRALLVLVDKKKYSLKMKHLLEREKNLDIKQTLATSLIVPKGEVSGVETKLKEEYKGKTVVLTTGTFLGARILWGATSIEAGRYGELPATELSQNLKKLGLEMERFKTGTSPRVYFNSLNLSQLDTQSPDEIPSLFSFWRKGSLPKKQIDCLRTFTNSQTHQIIQENLKNSPLYDGRVRGAGPRYCPSIEEKIRRFPERGRHPIFLQPEGRLTQEMHLHGLSTSFSEELQRKIVRSIRGLEEAEISRPGYAVEYDYVLPYQLKASLETKEIEGLYLAGQVIGTTGYEEAAALGIVSGINAALKAREKPPLILDRSQAYIGVLIDDLVTKGVDEPYRMFTSRAEYRLLLRSDNADLRLSHLGYQLGLLSEAQMKRVEEKRKRIEETVEEIKANRKSEDTLLERDLAQEVRAEVEAEVKYEGYIKKQERQVENLKHLEELNIPEGFDYGEIKGLCTETREKLLRIRPVSMGQASRISGIRPGELAILAIHLKKQ